MADGWDVVSVEPITDGWDVVEPKGKPLRERIARGVAMPAAGFNESVATTLGAIPDLIGSGMRAVGLPGPRPSFYTDNIRSGMRYLTGEPPKPENTTESLLYGAGKGAGDALGVALPAGALAQGARAGSLAQRVASTMAAQPGSQALAGAVGGAVGEATDSPIAGTAAAMATPIAASALMRTMRPIRPQVTPETERLLNVARSEGIPLSAGQQTGSKPLRYIEGAFDVLPGTSGAQAAFRQEQQAAFNQASLARSGTPGNIATADVLNNARARIGGEIGSIAGRNTLNVTPQLVQDLTGMADDVVRFKTAESAAPVIARIRQVLDHPDGAAIPGKFYRELDSALGRSMKSTSNGDVREGLGQLRERLRTAMDDSISPADRDAWQQARRDYANLMISAKAAGGAGENTAVGNISPLALRQAVDQSTGGGYVFGRGDQNDLARVGQAFLRPTPDSGTAGRTYMQGLLSGSLPGGAGIGSMLMGADPMTAIGAAGAAATLPRVAQKAYNSKLMQEYLINGVPGLNRIADQAPVLNRELMAALLAGRMKELLPSGQ